MEKRRFDVNREEVAREEIARTRVKRPFARVLIALFLAAIFVVPVVQMLWSLRKEGIEVAVYSPEAPGASAHLTADTLRGSFVSRLLRGNRRLIEAKTQFENRLQEQSFLRNLLTPPFQALLLHGLRSGNEKAIPARDGWLYYEPDVRFLTNGIFEPELAFASERGGESLPLPIDSIARGPFGAMLRFARELNQRNITLVVMPIPVKPMLYPEPLGRFQGQTTLRLPSLMRWQETLAKEGILLYDCTSVLEELKEEGIPVFLKTDTHWTPEAMEAAADGLSQLLRDKGLAPAPDSLLFVRENHSVNGAGDIVTMLELASGRQLYPPEEVALWPVITKSGEVWMPSRGSEILFLGDSFSNIYSLEGMGWGESAGFAEQLSWHLQAPVDAIRRNDAGASATRRILSNELQRGIDRLESKKVVVWSFAMRELAFGNWDDFSMALGKPRDSEFLRLQPGDSLWVSGQVVARSASLVPEKVIYADHLIAIHLADVVSENGSLSGGQAVVYLQDMKGRRLGPAASLRPGDRIRILLKSWEAVSLRYSGFNRSELDDFALQLEEPVWGESLATTADLP